MRLGRYAGPALSGRRSRERGLFGAAATSTTLPARLSARPPHIATGRRFAVPEWLSSRTLLPEPFLHTWSHGKRERGLFPPRIRSWAVPVNGSPISFGFFREIPATPRPQDAGCHCSLPDWYLNVNDIYRWLGPGNASAPCDHYVILLLFAVMRRHTVFPAAASSVNGIKSPSMLRDL